MRELADMTADELLSHTNETVFAWQEIRYRLERLEKCEAALKQIRLIPTIPFPDRQAHSERAFANAVWSAWCKIQDAARAALEGK